MVPSAVLTATGGRGSLPGACTAAAARAVRRAKSVVKAAVDGTHGEQAQDQCACLGRHGGLWGGRKLGAEGQSRGDRCTGTVEV